MAEESKSAKAAKKTPPPTKREVLLAVEIPGDVLAETLSDEQLALMGSQHVREGESYTLWLELGEADGSKDQAVDKRAGETIGRFRAPSMRAWRTGVAKEPPDQQSLIKSHFD